MSGRSGDADDAPAAVRPRTSAIAVLLVVVAVLCGRVVVAVVTAGVLGLSVAGGPLKRRQCRPDSFPARPVRRFDQDLSGYSAAWSSSLGTKIENTRKICDEPRWLMNIRRYSSVRANDARDIVR